MLIHDSIKSIKGIGPSKAKLLNRLNIETVEDLLYYFPKSYKDRSKLSLIQDCILDEFCTVKANIIGRPVESRSKNGLLVTKAVLGDSTGKITVVWFNNRFIKNMLSGYSEIILHGKISKYLTDVIMESPEIYKCEEKENINLFRIVPEYSLTEGLTSKEIRKYVYEALEKTEGMIQDIFSEEMRKKFGLAEMNFCIRNIHFPYSNNDLQLSQYRFKFEELFVVQYGLSQLKNMNYEKQGIHFKESQEIERVLNNLPFKLTKSQSSVLNEVFSDMKSDKVMNRLIQGDVGSGKTIIAILALFLCVKNGYQGLIMVPTEILAVQHFKYFCEVLEDENIKIEILKGNMSMKNKEKVLSQLNEGKTDILIGTHAIIEDNVKFRNLGLVITDEQHRFGVKQRALLSDKGESPDVLVMTATPIPRTLTLILYGDLDISIIHEKPLGRKKIETYYIDSRKKERLFGFVKSQLNDGRQAYVVCPLVEQSEKLELKSAVEHYEILKNEYFQDYRINLLHGKMKNSEKDKIMEDFRQGLTQILVSTTVIEVGVNVPNATIMVIENAERFGLAQLHQLRGRVGRGEYQSYCILISDSHGKVARERLAFLTKSDDGFEIADKDLQLRGGGEILGLKQHGLAEFKIADIYNDIEIVKASREAVNLLISQGFIDIESNKRMLMEINKRLNKMLEFIALN